MQFAEFNMQMLSQQAGLLCREGVYLSSRTTGNYFVALYGLFDFYVEVYYRRPVGELVVITAFQSTALLEPYLAKIDLRGVLQPVPQP
ncbi:MAG: hypothetical protein EOO14_19075 [Chitinophagaceae bacterium]|nr:MAG: hypothetical protein EOO14_19075 [Chitinophagaceae bacterium]